MERLGIRLNASQVVRGILVFGLLFMLGANLPGHMSYDSLAQLSEGRSGVRETWGPATYARILGFFDEIVPGTGLYVVASAGLLFFSLSTLRRLRGSVSWWAVLVALAIVLSPQFLIFQGVVWKDVLFANLIVAGFVCCARAEVTWGRLGPRCLALAGAVLCFALGALVRQNGLIVLPFAALALGGLRFRDGWRSALAWGGGGLLTVLVAMQVLGAAMQLKTGAIEGGAGVGIRILQHYDLVGAVAHDPDYPLSEVGKASPAAAERIRAGVANYSPERVDTLDRDPALGAALWGLSKETVDAEWRELVFRNPGTYLAVRADVFRWVFLTPRLQACVPQFVGVSGPEPLVAKLKLHNAVDEADQSLSNYATYLYDTPAYSHLTYAVIALIVAGFLLWRRNGADLVVAGLQIGALVFTASFLMISIACDYRYLYFLDVSAMVGLFYLVLDPPLGASSRHDPE